MSARTSASTRGRCTFTTTSSPVRRRAACTWAIDAAASGSSSNEEKIVCSGRAEVLLDDGAHVGERLGRHVVAQQTELGRPARVGTALAARDDLAELDVGGPEPLERPAQPALRSGRGSRAGPAPAGTRCRPRVRGPAVPGSAGRAAEPSPAEGGGGPRHACGHVRRRLRRATASGRARRPRAHGR